MNDENQTPPQPAGPPSQPDGITPQSPLPASPLGATGGAPEQPTVDAPAAQAATASQSNQPFSTQPNVSTRPVQAAPQQQTSALSTIASGFSSVLGAIFSWIIFPVAVVLILHNFVFQAYHVLGTSMMPTLQNTDYLIVSKVGYTEALIGRSLGKNDPYIPARGQIIVFHYPKDPTKIFVKRVIGLPGDHIVINNGNVTIYNTKYPNGFNPDLGFEPTGTQTLIDTNEVVAPDNLFVMGDNRTPGGSFDSREWGELPTSYIIGNVVLRLLPLDTVRVF